MTATEQRVDGGRLLSFDPPFHLPGQGFNGSEAGVVRTIFVSDREGESQVHLSTLIRGGFNVPVEVKQ